MFKTYSWFPPTVPIFPGKPYAAQYPSPAKRAPDHRLFRQARISIAYFSGKAP